MTITIKLKTDNASFEGNRDTAAFNIALSGVSRCLVHGRPASKTGYTLRDVNGNTVGSVTVTGK